MPDWPYFMRIVEFMLSGGVSKSIPDANVAKGAEPSGVPKSMNFGRPPHDIFNVGIHSFRAKGKAVLVFRERIGWIAVTLLVLALLLGLAYRTLWESGAAVSAAAACFRVGLVMAAWWLAFDELRRLPRWLWWVVPLGLILAGANRRFLPVAVVCLVVALLLQLRLPAKPRGE